MERPGSFIRQPGLFGQKESLPLFFQYWQVVRINVTLQTVGIFLMESCTMRLSVAVLTLRNLSVSLMAFCTMKFAVLGMVILQVLIDGGVTCTTDLVIHIRRIFQDVLGTVGPVTNETVGICLAGYMRFVAVKTRRFDTMLVGMTACTSHLLVVLAGISFHFLAFGLVMAYLTGNN